MLDIPYWFPSGFADIVSNPFHKVLDISIVGLGVEDLFDLKLIMSFHLYGWWF